MQGWKLPDSLSKEGVDVSLLEKENITGGHLNRWFKLFPDRRDSTEVKNYLDGLTHVNNIKFIYQCNSRKAQKG